MTVRAAVRWGVAVLLLAVGALLPTGAADAADLETGRTAYVDVAVATLWAEPGIDRPVDAPAVSDPVDMRAWTSGMTLQERLDLVGNLETQALLGTPVTVLERSGDWLRVAVHGQPTPRDDVGYPGWVPARQLNDSPSFAALRDRPFALVETATTQLYADARRTKPLMELSANTRLPVLGRAHGSLRVATPGRESAWLDARDAGVHRTPADIPAPTGEDLVRTAKMFVGLPYLWAGTSGFGFDCSGFTHTVYAMHGITIPRDSGPQSEFGIPVERDELREGDLIFYAYDQGQGRVHHVGMYIGDGYEADAPINTATEESPLEIVKVDEHRYADQYAGARRVLG